MRNKTKLIIIAGPQSSGKTTVFNLFKKKYSKLKFIDEINPFTLYGKNHLGGAFADGKIQEKIAKEFIKKIQKIKNSQYTWVIETGIFQLVYIEKFLKGTSSKIYLKKYLNLHNYLDPIILFIDTKPQVSWLRRKKYYLQRIANANIIDPKIKKQMLDKYNKNLYELYPLWLKFYNKIPFEKIVVKNSHKSKSKFFSEINNIINNIINQFIKIK